MGRLFNHAVFAAAVSVNTAIKQLINDYFFSFFYTIFFPAICCGKEIISWTRYNFFRCHPQAIELAMTGLIVKVQQQEQLELVKTLAGVINEYSQQTIIYVSSSVTSRTLLSMAKSFRVWTTVTKLGRLASVIQVHLSVRRKVTRSYQKHKMNNLFCNIDLFSSVCSRVR